ncbi:MAG: lipopolysaccharide biosynthesis protein [Alistipes sp.]|nr:lipopolysaccharide biosynthesis protein [Alistipes sp.]
MNELKRKTLFGSLWMLVERFGYLSVQFISNLVLARLLMPEDFGTIGIMMVFITLANVFIDTGFSASLIQKKDITEQDKSTVFITNITLAVIAYGILYFASPLIAEYFHNEELCSMLRVLGIILLIDAFCAIQNTLLTREMNFKLLTQIKLTSIFVAAFVAIILAYRNYGIWSLIVQYLLYSLIRVVSTWCITKWKPILTFSIKSFKNLFGFGSKLLISHLVAELYVNFQQILIGRYYTSVDLGYYSQARQFQQIPTGTISQVINSVAYPAYARMQNDRIALREMFRQNIRLVTYFNTAIMILLASIARPLITLMYSSKWLGAVGYFQFLCLGFGVFLAIHQCSLSVLKAVGRSDYVLILEIIKKILGILFIIIGLKVWGIWGILYALALNSFIEIFLNGYFLKKEIQYSGLNTLIDMLPSIFVAIVSGVVSYFSSIFIFNNNVLETIIVSSLIFIICFLLGSWIGHLYGFEVLKKSVISILKKQLEFYRNSKYKNCI